MRLSLVGFGKVDAVMHGGDSTPALRRRKADTGEP